jgi:hypothetical protein
MLDNSANSHIDCVVCGSGDGAAVPNASDVESGIMRGLA